MKSKKRHTVGAQVDQALEIIAQAIDDTTVMNKKEAKHLLAMIVSFGYDHLSIDAQAKISCAALKSVRLHKLIWACEEFHIKNLELVKEFKEQYQYLLNQDDE